MLPRIALGNLAKRVLDGQRRGVVIGTCTLRGVYLCRCAARTT